MNDLQAELKRHVQGAVRFDKVTRQLYSTDASMYQIDPIGVVFPRHEEDLQAVVEVAAERGVPVLPRGGGTALAGQSVGRAGGQCCIAVHGPRDAGSGRERWGYRRHRWHLRSGNQMNYLAGSCGVSEGI